MPLREQWACCFTRFYKNFGAKVTSPTESANFNAKSFIITGKSNAYSLFKALTALAARQLDTFKQKRAKESTRAPLEYLGRRYLGTLPTTVSYKALELINEEYKHSALAIPTVNRPAKPLTPCGNDCTAPLQFGVPCRHRIFRALTEDGQALKLGDIHEHWYLATPLSHRDPFLAIKDPRVAEKTRGRPKNKPEPMPPQHVIDAAIDNASQAGTPAVPPQSPNTPTVSRRRQQKKTVPRPPTGNAPRLTPSIRRNLSQWEIVVTPPRPRRRARGTRPPSVQEEGLQAIIEDVNGGEEAHGEEVPLRTNPHSGVLNTNAPRNGLLVARESSSQAKVGGRSRKRTLDNESSPEPPVKQTRYGRKVKPSEKVAANARAERAR